MAEYKIVYPNLTPWGRVTHIGVSKSNIIVQIMDCRLVGAKPLSELKINLQWNVKPNPCISIQENASENIFWKMAVILSRPQWIKQVILVSKLVMRTSQLVHSHVCTSCCETSCLTWVCRFLVTTSYSCWHSATKQFLNSNNEKLRICGNACIKGLGFLSE